MGLGNNDEDSQMIGSIVIVWSLVLVLGIIALRRSKETVRQAGRAALEQGRILLLRVPLAVLVAAFLVELVPRAIIQNALGEESGLNGILIASVAGGLLPGGPFVSFPIAVAFYKAGVGTPQMIALITAWSIYAVHRVLTFELPIMGTRFILLRLACSVMFPPLAGIISALAFKVVSVF